MVVLFLIMCVLVGIGGRVGKWAFWCIRFLGVVFFWLGRVFVGRVRYSGVSIDFFFARVRFLFVLVLLEV